MTRRPRPPTAPATSPDGRDDDAAPGLSRRQLFGRLAATAAGAAVAAIVVDGATSGAPDDVADVAVDRAGADDRGVSGVAPAPARRPRWIGHC
ncbi:MAG: hypothetical protein H6709_03160 [Kofleriaceae bacterium]|nr:hypothetical protein [Kofleriaceae bacterium]MCB9571068.1 hypothetical protein [Kofleriaceae bacterium]